VDAGADDDHEDNAAALTRDQLSVSTIWAPSAARYTDSHPFRAAALVSYASPVATTCPLDAFSRNRYLPARSSYTSNLPAIPTLHVLVITSGADSIGAQAREAW
jgi:hypothetical protein